MKARLSYRWEIALIACLVMTISAVKLAGAEPLSERERERETFRQGWAAAQSGDLVGFIMSMGALPDYPLVPYLEAELLRQRVDQVPEAVMAHFLTRHRGWSFAPTLETTWLRSLGQRGEHQALRRHGRDSTDPEVRCYQAAGRIEAQEHEGLAGEIAGLWLVGRSQPEACDPVFTWWQAQGNPAPDLAWQRFQLALEAGDLDLARYLGRYLAGEEREWAERWLNMQARPHDTLGQARQWRDQPRARQLISSGLRQLVRRDGERAELHWQALAPAFSWSASEQAAIARELALYRAVRLDGEAVAAIDALPDSARDQQILEWRARAALAHGNWPVVLTSIEAMAAAEQEQGRWRYWRGRALAALENPEALTVLAALAREPHYYGFLAAAHLGRAFNLCSEELAADSAVQARLLGDLEFERALELFQVGLYDHARRTWNRVARRLSQSELEQAALLLTASGWYDRAIAALNNPQNRQAYPWRFPLAEKGLVMAEAEQRRVNPALVYGLMRAESAMQRDALSPAGAQGLLQLMPGTAREVARRNGLAYNGAGDLLDPATNIALGIAHLAELEERYAGNWVLVAAAYNAGINAVARWLDERPPAEPDIWLETLPYHETREYVPRILAFATIYEWQLAAKPGVLAANMLGRVADSGRFACPE